jgi:dipeptidase
VEGAEPYPLWIKPDRKLSLKDVMDLMRDHYEGTGYDMTEGVDAGPFGTPNRWRPMTWNIDGTDYTWERPISTQQTGFSFISQSRSWLPDPVGGVIWYGLDDTYFSCYIPLYCGIDDIPPSFTVGSIWEFSWDSAWWIFNLVANFSNLRYCQMRSDIQAVQSELEDELIALQPAVDMTAGRLYQQDRELMTAYLTDFCRAHGERTVSRWRELAENMIRKYNDGYTQKEPGRPSETGYPERWLREVIKSRPEQFRLEVWGELETDLPY